MFNAFQSFLMLLCTYVPGFIERTGKVSVPNVMSVVFICFCLAHFVIGEIGELYVKSKIFDSILHTLSGSMIAILGFSIIRLLNDSDKSDLSTLLGQLSQMKTMKNKWMKSPHKAIYLMALICGIRAGHINHRKICLDDYLIQTFKDLWVKYVPIGFPYAMEIGNPFMHLSSEPFYFLHTISDIPDFNIGWSVSAVKRVCDYAYVSDDFRNIIMSDDNTREITQHLINEFGLKGCGDFTLANIQNDQNNTAFSNNATCVPKLPKPKIT